MPVGEFLAWDLVVMIRKPAFLRAGLSSRPSADHLAPSSPESRAAVFEATSDGVKEGKE